MEIKALGYVRVAAPNLDEWASFATRLLGLQCHDKTQHTLALRMDDRQQRLLVDGSLPEGKHCYGWEVAGAAALASLAARLDKAGVAVRAESSATAQQRGVRELISFSDPAGNQLEAFHGACLASTPFAPSRPLAGFRTGGLGLGHAVLTVANAAPLLTFYRDLLSFGLSDYMLSPFKAYFLHLNPRHHSLALIETGVDGLHHVMLELLSFDDVGQTYDIALGEDERIGVTLGRHTNDFMTSFYARSPSAFMVECGWGGREIDPGTWQPQEFFHGPSLWGHERYWLAPEKRQQARDIRLQAARDGFKAPVHVLAGNHVVMPPR